MSATIDALPDFAPHLFDAEDRHFWFRSRNKVIGRVVRQLVAELPPGYRVLEVGCGNGNVLRVLERVCVGGTVVGMDLVAEKLRFARRRTACELRVGDLYRLPPEEKFDLIGMFDVLEHLPDDATALQSLANSMTLGGRLLLTVPAHRTLWSYADTHAGHQCRYSVAQLREVLATNGWEVEYCTQFMAALYPLMWFGRRLSALWRASQHGPQGERELFQRELRIVPGVNGLLTRLVECEAPFIARRKRLPIGTSLLAVARRAETNA